MTVASTESLRQLLRAVDFREYGKSMTSAATTPHLLLIMNFQGSTIAVRFPSAAAAEEWEEQHENELGEVVGLVPIVTKAEALRG